MELDPNGAQTKGQAGDLEVAQNVAEDLTRLVEGTYCDEETITMMR